MSSEFEAVVNIVQVQPEKYGKDFDVMVSYIGQMVTKRATMCNLSLFIRLVVS